MEPEETARRILSDLSRGGPQTSSDEATGVVLAHLARFAAARDALWMELRLADVAYRDAVAAPRNSRRFSGRRDPGVETASRARMRRDLALAALGVEI